MAGDLTARPGRVGTVWALQVTDDDRYREYRAQMTPILHRHGGAFGYDFVIARVLASATPQPINRVFTITFPDRATEARFFADPAYLAVRRTWFEPAVSAITELARFEDRGGA